VGRIQGYSDVILTINIVKRHVQLLVVSAVKR